ncbi:hypothetical protein CORMATOL_01177 [Corynebacterium matruchotii ATCC 33806]|uniref:Uncharacterized protein n=1 Tax=Corynebacterium matruchotii ATCC 33806 TaxID=566549 RepID=C0E2H2_9CORY|nr:hypothetical protein CORMATOL_01177 [Corynebacterium matruchotii ATCC 33806]
MIRGYAEAGIMFFHLLHHGRFDGRRCGFNKFTLFFQGGKQLFAGYAKLLG